ncbi:mycothione reductase [Nesterenkonia jeotgali]|uniref:Mycothione reductase n=1 Tax=Nesterenkonia jeotgali TaxID=317018 RepID=A0A839FRI0_9MICC|nr:mycothione reductase [Nesterenkonia jeotgali]MBA8920533.1 mycothione reductase [Nesterenkonia jeotgali]
MAHYDLSIIGSGSGNSLITPFWDDKRVVLADKGSGSTAAFGGTCLNVGCIPTKMFVRPAALARGPEEAARLNLTQETTAVDFPAMRDRIFSRVDAISAGGRHYREVELEHVDLVAEQVRLTGDLRQPPFAFVSDSGVRAEADQLVIAAGSRPTLPQVPGIELPGVHTSDSVMRIEQQPQKLLVIGGGYIACEFAGIFSGLGTEVIQVNRSHGLMKAMDTEISTAFSTEAERNWTVHYERTLSRIVEHGAGLRAELVSSDGRVEHHDVDAVLVAIGRTPNTDLIGAAEAGLDLHPDGRLAVDEYQRVLIQGEPVAGLYALGDISSEAMLKHVANHEARVVAHNLEHPERIRASRQDVIPSAIFSFPEMAQVGLTEAQAVDTIGEDHVTTKVQNYGDTAYGWAMEDGHGIFKVIADRRSGQILGAHVMGYQASNLIQPIIQAMSFGQDAYTAARGQYWIHPALMEVTENALLGLEVPIPEDAPL